MFSVWAEEEEKPIWMQFLFVSALAVEEQLEAMLVKT